MICLKGKRKTGWTGMQVTKPTLSYWLVAGLGLVWNLMGCLNYITQTNPDVVAQMPEAYQTLIANRPTWATGAFAIGVFGGAVGCILLLLKRAVAKPVFILSLAGVVLTTLHAVVSSGASLQVALSAGSSVLVAVVLLWVAVAAGGKGWLR
jgi:hypothetical protein